MRLRHHARVALPILIIGLIATSFVCGALFGIPLTQAETGNETTYYFLTDHLGSVDVVSDEQGNVVEWRDYLPYGSARAELKEPGAPLTDYGFTGKEKDDETGLNYYGARYYDAVTGRFVSVDPWAGNLRNPQTLNKYAYVLNNPVRYVDPTGAIAKEASFLSKLVSVLTYGASGQGDGWLAQSAKNYAGNPNEATQADMLSKQSEALNRFITAPSSFTDETWDPITTQRIGTLDPKVQIPATDFINDVEENENTTLRVTDGYRSIEEQDRIYAQGRTTPGKIVSNAKGGTSYHNYGLAIDVVIMEDGKTRWEKVSDDIVNLATGLGFEWGGYWDTPDNPHFQMTFGQSIKELQDKQSEE